MDDGNVPSVRLSIINVVIAYFQIWGKTTHSLLTIMMRNLILFIPGIVLLNEGFGLNGAIAAQPVVEVIIAIVCAALFFGTRSNR